jgi:hypothetical protein
VIRFHCSPTFRDRIHCWPINGRGDHNFALFRSLIKLDDGGGAFLVDGRRTNMLIQTQTAHLLMFVAYSDHEDATDPELV